jgi:nucleoside-diphosphate-sugar epimerase
MIVGRGLLAQAFGPHFAEDPRFVIFASGVSNSLETRPEEFAREAALLREWVSVDVKRFVYFGSCGVTAPESELTPYMLHKQAMESLVLAAPHGLVLRLPQVVGHTSNSRTLTNFLRNHIVSGEHFTVWARAERNLIDIDDIVGIGSWLATKLPSEATAVSIAAIHSLPMPRIVEIFERVLGRAANCTYVEQGAPMIIDTRTIEGLAPQLGIDLGEGYIERVIEKYYAADQCSDIGNPPPSRACITRTTAS